MPTYEQLYHLGLRNLAAAAERWEETVTKLKGLHAEYGDQVARPFRQAGWTQPVATAARADTEVRAAQQQFESAHEEAKGVAGVLTSLHAELKEAKDELHRLADVEAKKENLHVSATGTVTPRNNLSQDSRPRYDPDSEAVVRLQQEVCDAFVRRIERVLRRAAHADELACWALRIDVGGSRGGFNSGVVTSLDDAEAARAAELRRRDARTKADGWIAASDVEVSGSGAGTSVTGPDTGSGKLGEAETHADLGRAVAEGSLTDGPMRLAGEAEAYVGAKAGVDGGITHEGMRGGGGVFVGGEYSAKGRVDLGPVGVYGRAESTVGAEAGAAAGVGPDGVQLGGAALAGARVSASGGADIGGIGAGATVEGWAGPGAEATLNFGKDANGAWHWAPKVGVSPAIGGAVGFEITVDPRKVADTAGSAADAVGDAAGWCADELSSRF